MHLWPEYPSLLYAALDLEILHIIFLWDAAFVSVLIMMMMLAGLLEIKSVDENLHVQ